MPHPSPLLRAVAGLLGRFITQDRARTNAAQASIRLGHERRQVEDADRFVEELRGTRTRAADERRSRAAAPDGDRG